MRERLRITWLSGAIGGIVGIVLVQTAESFFWGALIGCIISLLLYTTEVLVLRKLRRVRFSYALMLKSAVYMIIIAATMISINFITDARTDLLRYIQETVFTPSFGIGLMISLAISLLMNFFILINRLLGKNTLKYFLLGKYHSPSEEERIFMFLDIKDSTSIAESIGHMEFQSFLNEFIYDITGSIVSAKGEIYKYVGDEVIVTWRMKDGLEKANCIRCYVNIRRTLESMKHKYMTKYGKIPDFRVGMHCGPVVVSEMGDYKKEIGYFGDVVNTASRIQQECKTYNRDILLSAKLFDYLKGREAETLLAKFSFIGGIQLRGKEEIVELLTLDYEQALKWS